MRSSDLRSPIPYGVAASAATNAATFGLPKPVVRSHPVVVATPGTPVPYCWLLSSVAAAEPLPNVRGTVSLKTLAGSE